jgi:hypothetical protein
MLVMKYYYAAVASSLHLVIMWCNNMLFPTPAHFPQTMIIFDKVEKMSYQDGLVTCDCPTMYNVLCLKRHTDIEIFIKFLISFVEKYSHSLSIRWSQVL